MTGKAQSQAQSKAKEAERQPGNLGQKEAQQQEKSESELRHMEQGAPKQSGT
jgi:hypothetical protein